MLTVPLFFFPFHRVWQLERTGQGSSQQKHSSCGSKSSVLPSPEARPPGMWQGQPIFPTSGLTWDLGCPCLVALRETCFSVVREAEEKESLGWQPDLRGFLAGWVEMCILSSPKPSSHSSRCPCLTLQVCDRHLQQQRGLEVGPTCPAPCQPEDWAGPLVTIPDPYF